MAIMRMLVIKSHHYENVGYKVSPFGTTHRETKEKRSN
jgi:hypothetical protein